MDDEGAVVGQVKAVVEKDSPHAWYRINYVGKFLRYNSHEHIEAIASGLVERVGNTRRGTASLFHDIMH